LHVVRQELLASSYPPASYTGTLPTDIEHRHTTPRRPARRGVDKGLVVMQQQLAHAGVLEQAEATFAVQQRRRRRRCAHYHRRHAGTAGGEWKGGAQLPPLPLSEHCSHRDQQAVVERSCANERWDETASSVLLSLLLARRGSVVGGCCGITLLTAGTADTTSIRQCVVPLEHVL
jgi:hypothetical protein